MLAPLAVHTTACASLTPQSQHRHGSVTTWGTLGRSSSPIYPNGSGWLLQQLLATGYTLPEAMPTLQNIAIMKPIQLLEKLSTLPT